MDFDKLSRRDFLKKTTVLAVGVTLLGLVACSEKDYGYGNVAESGDYICKRKTPNCTLDYNTTKWTCTAVCVNKNDVDDFYEKIVECDGQQGSIIKC